MKSRFWMGAALLALQLLWTGAAQSRVWLKPKGSDAMPLRAKALSAEVVIEKQFATTRNVMTFQNETSQQIEADFFYTVPEGSVVTYFAYWYQDEKVVARVVEKERAAAIYKHITSRMRDPALVEMIGRNTFRARIFPIEPNADLRIEMHFAQVLKSEARGAVYTFPLEPEEAGKGTLEKLDVQVQVKRDAALTGVWNNYKLPVAADGGGYATKLSQRNYRAHKDFEIHLQRQAAPLRAALYAAPSGGRDGFFALAITLNRAFARPSLQIQGVQVYDVVPAKLPKLKAGQSTLICGRYRGGGSANVTLRDGRQSTLSVPISFGTRAENNNVATKLWAARHIENLSANIKNRDAVMQLSKRFTLPSKFTSWLAVPKAELIRFKQEKIQADLSVMGRRYALEVANGRVAGGTARALKAQFSSLARQVTSYYDANTLDTYLASTLRELRRAEREQRFAEKPDRRAQSTLKRQMKRLQRAIGKSGSEEPIYIIEEDMRVTSRAYLDAVTKNGTRSRRARLARAELNDLSRRTRNYGWNWDTFVDEAIAQRGARDAELLVREQFERVPNAGRIAQLQRQLRALDRVQSGLFKRSLEMARSQWLTPKMSELAQNYIDAKNAATPDTQRAAAAQRELDRIAKLGGVSTANFITTARSDWAQRALEATSLQLVEEKYAARPDANRIAVLQREIERIERVGQARAQSDYRVVRRLTEIQEKLRGQYVEELKKPKPDRARLTELEARMTNVYRDPKYSGNQGSYYNSLPDRVEEPLKLPKITQLKTELEAIDAQQAKAPTRLAQLDKKRADVVDKLDYATKYFLRLGDPLISIDAPQDAQNVVAVLPGGEVKTLVWNTANRKWEARFDIPSYAAEGSYTITVIIVDQSGARRTLDIHYRVDMTAPAGAGRAQSVASQSTLSGAATQVDTTKLEGSKLRLEVDGSEDTTRVFALLPWGDKVELGPSAAATHRFFVLVNVPKTQQKNSGAVTYILTDKAHNRTQITVDVSK